MREYSREHSGVEASENWEDQLVRDCLLEGLDLEASENWEDQLVRDCLLEGLDLEASENWEDQLVRDYLRGVLDPVLLDYFVEVEKDHSLALLLVSIVVMLRSAPEAQVRLGLGLPASQR